MTIEKLVILGFALAMSAVSAQNKLCNTLRDASVSDADKIKLIKNKNMGEAFIASNIEGANTDEYEFTENHWISFLSAYCDHWKSIQDLGADELPSPNTPELTRLINGWKTSFFAGSEVEHDFIVYLLKDGTVLVPDSEKRPDISYADYMSRIYQYVLKPIENDPAVGFHATFVGDVSFDFSYDDAQFFLAKVTTTKEVKSVVLLPHETNLVRDDKHMGNVVLLKKPILLTQEIQFHVPLNPKQSTKIFKIDNVDVDLNNLVLELGQRNLKSIAKRLYSN